MKKIWIGLLGILVLLNSCHSLKDAEKSKNAYTLKDVKNPLIPQRADPWIYQHVDGNYYFIATVPEYDRLEIRRSKTLDGLAVAKAVTIWTRHDSGEMGAHIWAPELHFIEDKWYIYFAAGRKDAIWDIEIYVLENSTDNPLTGTWKEKGKLDTSGNTIKTGMMRFALDGTTFLHKEKRYFVWAQKNRRIPGNTSLYIAEMLNPWTIKGDPVCISSPEFSWEQQLFWVNEGPAVLIQNGKVFITYSASGTDHNYCMGLLTASEDLDLLDPESWVKSSTPVFQSSEETGIYGPGHSCFTKSEDGLTDILVYHARSYKEIDGDPLADPNRHTRIQKILWTENGTPNFGFPVSDNNK